MKTNDLLVSFLAVSLMTLPLVSQADGPNTIEYSGKLVALPCTVHPDNNYTNVYFGENVNIKDLYTGERGEYSDRTFQFKLEKCNTSLGKTISAKFSGEATPDGLLKLDLSSEASGVVIGLETATGQQLPINNAKVEPVYPISDGDLTIPIRAYLKADPTALQNKTIKPGWFNATLTYTLIYE